MDITSKKYFYDNFVSKKTKENVKGAAICAYISVVATSLYAIIIKDYFLFLDVVLLLVLGLGIHFKRSRACSVIILIYGCISTIIVFLETGRFMGWLIIVAGVFAIMGTFKFHKEYNEYIVNCESYKEEINSLSENK